MKKLKLLSLALAVIMILSAFAGCGDKDSDKKDAAQAGDKTSSTVSGDNNNGNSSDTDTDSETESPKGYITTKEAFLDKASKILDLSLYDDLLESENFYSYSINYTNKKEYALDYKIKLGDGSEFTLPVAFSELEKMGWSFLQGTEAERKIEANIQTITTLKNTNGQTLGIWIYNDTSKTLPLKDCIVGEIRSEQYDQFDGIKPNTAIDFSVCGSLNQASTLEDIVEKLGNPSSLSYSIFFDLDEKYEYSTIQIDYDQKSSASNRISFELSGDGNFITKIKYSKMR